MSGADRLRKRGRGNSVTRMGANRRAGGGVSPAGSLGMRRRAWKAGAHREDAKSAKVAPESKAVSPRREVALQPLGDVVD